MEQNRHFGQKIEWSKVLKNKQLDEVFLVYCRRVDHSLTRSSSENWVVDIYSDENKAYKIVENYNKEEESPDGLNRTYEYFVIRRNVK